MNESTSVTAMSTTVDTPASWRIRHAEPRDIGGIAKAVAELLAELGGTPPPQAALQQASAGLISTPAAGVIFVAESDETLIGVLGASWQSAIHIPGRYGLIQDLWVHSAWRGRAIGGALIAALHEHARTLGISRIEVGLPKESFAGLPATAAFYRANGFTPLGPRMRLELP